MDQKLQKLTKQYPFLNTILEQVKTSFSVRDFKDQRVSIKVQRMDADLMYFQGKVQQNGYTVRIPKGKGKQLCGRSYQRTYFIDQTPHNTAEMTRIDWSVFENQVYRVKDHLSQIGDVASKIQAIVNVEATKWYFITEDWSERGWEDPLDFDTVSSEQASQSHAEIECVIYLPPDQDLWDLIYHTRLETDVTLDSHEAMRYALHGDKSYAVIDSMLLAFADVFSEKVFYSGLRQRVNENRFHGMKAEYQGIDFMIYTMAGRMMITLQSGDNQISLIGEEKEPDPKFHQEYHVPMPKHRFGLSSYYGKFADLRNIMLTVIKGWEDGKIQKTIAPDGKVGLL